MLTGDDFRGLALDLDGVVEGAHMGHPDFRANGRIFASLRANEESGNVKLTPDEQQVLMKEHPRMFTPAAGAWGRQGWTVVELKAATVAPVRGALVLALQNVMNEPARRTAAKRTATKAVAPKPKRRTAR